MAAAVRRGAAGEGVLPPHVVDAGTDHCAGRGGGTEHRRRHVVAPQEGASAEFPAGRGRTAHQRTAYENRTAGEERGRERAGDSAAEGGTGEPHGAHIGHTFDWHTDVQPVAAAPVHRRGHRQGAAMPGGLLRPTAPEALAGVGAQVQRPLHRAVHLPHHAG